jgi:hypothetical protein
MDDEIRNRLKVLRDRLAPAPGFPHVLVSGADITELIDCLVAMNPKPKITITNNIASEDRAAKYGSECAAKFADGLTGLPPRLVAPLTDVVNNLTVVRRPWWKFWSK